MKTKLLSIILIVVIATRFITYVDENKEALTRPFYPKTLTTYQDLFDQSQYVVVGSTIHIPDEFFYSLAAWKYLHGENPILFNAEQPPLGKYFIAATINWFNNERLTGPIFNLLVLLALLILAWVIFKSIIWSLALTALFGFEKLFLVQIRYAPLLDNIQLFFILMSFFFYIQGLKNRQLMIWAYVFLGLVISVKFWVTGAVILMTWVAHQLIFKSRVKLLKFLVLAPISLIPLIMSYLPALLHGENLRKIFAVQKYILVYHQGKFTFDPIALWDLLIFNRWHVGWEGVTKSAVDWQITWSLVTILSFIAIWQILKKNWLKNLQSPIGLIAIWVTIYLVFLLFGTVLPRYLIPVLPALYILAFWQLRIFLVKLNPRIKL